MAFETITAHIPETAKDLKLNLTSLARQNDLSDEQLNGALYVAALTCKHDELIALMHAEVKESLSPEYLSAVETAAALMGMNNVFYRFRHMVENDTYSTLPAGLRMNGLRSHGIAQKDFELFSLVASAITGCGMCIVSHERALKEAGMTEAEIQTAVRVAAIVHGLAVALSVPQ